MSEAANIWNKFSKRANAIAKNLGTRSAAGFLRNREVSLESALAILGMPERKWCACGKLVK